MGDKKSILTDTRITGLLYLGIALTGMFAFLFARSKIFVDGNAITTAANLIEKATLARQGIVFELALVIFQALAAVWFYKLFRKVDSFAAILIAAFGMANAILILIASATWLATLNASIAGDAASAVYNLFNLHETIWLVGGIFFGLWLIPMGYLALRANMPRALAWLLIAGGIGYILSTVVLVLFPEQKTISGMLPLPATIGEFWMVGYLLMKSKLNV